jgi:DNA-binding response OmpR family regulator
MHILLIEDDELLADQIVTLLKRERYDCDVCHNIADATLAYEENSYQLLLVDWNLPDGSGLSLLHKIRRCGDDIAVIMLSGRERVEERVEALDGGADDYLCKPYSNIELLARVRAILRRESTQRTSILEIGDVRVDLTRREVSVADIPIELTYKEFELLEVLVLHKNRVLSRFQLNELLCKDFDSIKSSNIVDVHIKNIRKKLNRPEIITTIRGVGYSIKEKS